MELSSSLKNLDIDSDLLEEAISDHTIAAITDEHGIIVYANQKFCEISQFSEDELLGQNHRLLKSGFHSNEFYSEMWDTIISGKTWHGEVKNSAKDGSYYWVKTTIFPLVGSDGKTVYYIALRTDITSQKEIEERLLDLEQKLMIQNEDLISKVEEKSRDLVKSERLATIGTMASRIAHDLKNPLTILHTYAEMLTPEILSKLESRDKEKWFRMQNSIFDMNRIIEDVLDS